MAGGRPSTYDPAYCEQVIELGRQGKSQVQISGAIDVPRTTMLSWAEQHPEFSTALTRAKELEQEWWENAGQNGIFLDKFNATVWKTSMAARFRDDYTERKEVSANVRITHEDVLDDLSADD
jgi:hypothetical protein